jgi:hypothetical protein
MPAPHAVYSKMLVGRTASQNVLVFILIYVIYSGVEGFPWWTSDMIKKLGESHLLTQTCDSLCVIMESLYQSTELTN